MISNNFMLRNNYNKSQIGSNEDKILRIKRYLKKIKVSYISREKIISFISYQKQDTFIIAAYLDLLSRSLTYFDSIDTMSLLEIIKDVHDVYQNLVDINLNEFYYLKSDEIIEKLYIDKNVTKSFATTNHLNYLNELRFIAAIHLNNKEYRNLFNSLTNSNIAYSAHYQFELYKKLRTSLSLKTKLFFDIYFANEYLIELHKVKITMNKINYKKNIQHYNKNVNYKNYYLSKISYEIANVKPLIQLSLFNEEKENKVTNYYNAYICNFTDLDYEIFQNSFLYDEGIELPIIDTKYGLKLLTSEKNEEIILPKMKETYHQGREVINY